MNRKPPCRQDGSAGVEYTHECNAQSISYFELSRSSRDAGGGYKPRACTAPPTLYSLRQRLATTASAKRETMCEWVCATSPLAPSKSDAPGFETGWFPGSRARLARRQGLCPSIEASRLCNAPARSGLMSGSSCMGKKRTEKQEQRRRDRQRQRQLDMNERRRSSRPEIGIYYRDRRRSAASDSPLQKWDYAAYIKSPEWRLVRKAYFASRLRQRCVVCDATKNIHLHHRTYKRLGQERLHDLEPLCAPCHAATHDLHRELLASGKRLSLFKASKRLKAQSRQGGRP